MSFINSPLDVNYLARPSIVLLIAYFVCLLGFAMYLSGSNSIGAGQLVVGPLVGIGTATAQFEASAMLSRSGKPFGLLFVAFITLLGGFLVFLAMPKFPAGFLDFAVAVPLACLPAAIGWRAGRLLRSN
jgi:hypothetical protein